MSDPIRDAAIEAAARYAWCEIHGYELDAWEDAAVRWQGDLLRKRWAPLVDAVLAVAGPALRAEAFRDAADLITEYAWQPDDGLDVPPEHQAWYIAAVGNAVAVSACVLRDRADAEEGA